MYWFRMLVRFTLAFVVLYLLGYVVSGFSGLTVPLLVVIGAAIAASSALVESRNHFGSSWERTVFLFLTSGAIIYIFTFILVGRPPVVSTILASVLVSVVEFAFPRPIRKEKKMLP